MSSDSRNYLAQKMIKVKYFFSKSNFYNPSGVCWCKQYKRRNNTEQATIVLKKIQHKHVNLTINV